MSHILDSCPRLAHSQSGFTMKRDEMYYVPLTSSLQQLLSNKAILEEVCTIYMYNLLMIESVNGNVLLFSQIEKNHQQSGDCMKDFCDGMMYQNHPLFSTDPTALQIILYYDDVEICNPLGSKAKVHKLGTCMFAIFFSRFAFNN